MSRIVLMIAVFVSLCVCSMAEAGETLTVEACAPVASACGSMMVQHQISVVHRVKVRHRHARRARVSACGVSAR